MSEIVRRYHNVWILGNIFGIYSAIVARFISHWSTETCQAENYKHYLYTRADIAVASIISSSEKITRNSNNASRLWTLHFLRKLSISIVASFFRSYEMDNFLSLNVCSDEGAQSTAMYMLDKFKQKLMKRSSSRIPSNCKQLKLRWAVAVFTVLNY